MMPNLEEKNKRILAQMYGKYLKNDDCDINEENLSVDHQVSGSYYFYKSLQLLVNETPDLTGIDFFAASTDKDPVEKWIELDSVINKSKQASEFIFIKCLLESLCMSFQELFHAGNFDLNKFCREFGNIEVYYICIIYCFV